MKQIKSLKLGLNLHHFSVNVITDGIYLGMKKELIEVILLVGFMVMMIDGRCQHELMDET